MAAAINIQIRYVPEISQGAHGSFTAICREFDLAASGDTKDEARDRLRAIVESYCSALQKKGILDRAIRESGVRSESVEREPDEEIVSVAA